MLNHQFHESPNDMNTLLVIRRICLFLDRIEEQR